VAQQFASIVEEAITTTANAWKINEGWRQKRASRLLKRNLLSHLFLLAHPSIKLALLLFPLCIWGKVFLPANFIIFGNTQGNMSR
jgi:hypothetical protein